MVAWIRRLRCRLGLHDFGLAVAVDGRVFWRCRHCGQLVNGHKS